MDSKQTYFHLGDPFPPPPKRKHWIEVRRPAAGEKLHGRCLNQEVVATATHWDELMNGKVRCCEGCERCKQGEEPRWYAYMPVLCDSLGRVMCFEITVQAARDCPELTTKRVPLRGKTLTIGRHGSRGKFGRCWCTITDYSDRRPLPPPQNPDELLERVFRFMSRFREPSAPLPNNDDGKSRGAGE